MRRIFADCSGPEGSPKLEFDTRLIATQKLFHAPVISKWLLFFGLWLSTQLRLGKRKVSHGKLRIRNHYI